jgi:Putative DNA-binding domain
VIPPTVPVTGDDRLPALIVSAIRGYAEVSLNDLFSIFEMPESVPALAKVEQILKFTEHYGLTLIPALEKGDLATTRRLSLKAGAPTTADKMRDEVKGGEGERLELKSSLQYDREKARNYAGALGSELRSDGVLHSCLKTIAAFLNSEGGILYVGLDNSGAAVGIAEDLLLLKEEKRNADHWELMLRDAVRAKFKDGDTINDYLRAEFLDCAGKLVARIEVYPRRRLSFVRYQERYFLYRRQGNRTAEVTIDQVEEFLAQRAV